MFRSFLIVDNVLVWVHETLQHRALEEICSHLNSSENPSTNAGIKNAKRSKIIIIIIIRQNLDMAKKRKF